MSDPTDIDRLLPPGTVLSGKYEVVRVLGRGGMGVVVEARHLKMARGVAIKILLPAMRVQADVVARFEREARAAAQLRDQHVARVLDVDTLPDGSPYMVMELLRGEDLAQRLVRRGRLPYREAVGLMLEACAGMIEAHRAGIIHRDLKPQNLFIDAQGSVPVLKVLDFGISKITGDVSASMTATSTAFGTPLYMSPEQVRSAKNVDARADVWSLGVVLYEMLAGEPPFLASSATGILAAIIADKPVPIAVRCPDIPAALGDMVMRALEKDPAARVADVQSFAAGIAPFSAEGDPTVSAFSLPSIGAPVPAPAATNMAAVGVTAPVSKARSFAPIVLGMGLSFAIGGAVLVTMLRRPGAPVAADAPSSSAVAEVGGPVVAPGAPVTTASASAAPVPEPAPRAPVVTSKSAPSSKPSASSSRPPVPAGPAVTPPAPPAEHPKYL